MKGKKIPDNEVPTMLNNNVAERPATRTTHAQQLKTVREAYADIPD